jgi:peptidyl-prolyl cis-trans isomerase A (cyclophilin A)
MKVPRVSWIVCLAGLMCLAIGCENGTAEDPAINPVDSANGSLPPEGPAEYWVKLDTTKGDVVIEVHRAWSPYGADRFYELVKSGFYDRCRFFRVVGFVVQFGISGDVPLNMKWRDNNIPDDKYQRNDPARHTNARGYLTFAKSPMPNSRTTQIFINCVDNSMLDRQGFTPFGRVISGMAAIDALYSGYGDEPASQASQERMQTEGDAYLNAAFPKLDSIKTVTLLPGKPKEPANGNGGGKADEAKTSEAKPSAAPPAPAKK